MQCPGSKEFSAALTVNPEAFGNSADRAVVMEI